MSREIAWEHAATREMDALPRRIRESIYGALARLAIENRGDVKRLQGPFAGSLRLRVGEYRVRFRLEGATGRIVVLAVTTRAHAYKE